MITDPSQSTPRQETPDETLAAYKRSAVTASWAGRGSAFWGIAGLGLIMGAAIGAVAPFFPVIVGAQSAGAAVALLPHSLAVFAAVGALMGSAGGAMVGTVAGAAAGVAAEQERRLSWHGIVFSPAAEPEQQEDKKSFSDTLSEYVNLKVGATVAVIGAVGGALLAGAYIALGGLAGTGGGEVALPALKLLLGPAASNPVAVTAYCAGVIGSMGAAAWSVNFPKIAESFQHFAFDVTSGKLLGTQWGPAPKQESTQAPEATPEASLPEMPTRRSSSPSAPGSVLLAESVRQQAVQVVLHTP